MRRLIIDKTALAENVRAVKTLAGEAAVYGVLKADGYGLGLLPLARALLENGVDQFAVTEPAAARLLQRESGRETLLLCPVPSEGMEPLLRAGRTVFSVGSAEEAAALAKAGLRTGVRPRAHIQVDTGLGRYGFRWDDPFRLRFLYESFTAVSFEGIYTHFAGRESMVRRQFRRFSGLVEALRSAGIDPGLRHCCGSGALPRHPEMALDAVRVGSALLGRVPGGERTGLRDVCRCEAAITVVRTLRPGDVVGYGSRFRAVREMTVAVADLGALHGLGAKAACGRQSPGAVFMDMLRQGRDLFRPGLAGTVSGRRVPVLGKLCAECCVLDVTGIDCAPGDVVAFSLNPMYARGMERIWTDGGSRGNVRPVA